MKKFVLLLLCLLLVSGTKANAHSGRTDSAGGHYDRSNGEYHFHHGYPEHQHYDGICPYEEERKEELRQKELRKEKADKIAEYCLYALAGGGAVIGGASLYAFIRENKNNKEPKNRK